MEQAVILVIGLLFLASLLAMLVKKVKIPFTVLLVAAGVLVGAWARSGFGLGFLASFTLSPEVILYVFLPALIFESAFNLDSRLLLKNLAPILTLAVPAWLVSTFVVGLVLNQAGDLALPVALLFGALISDTDPVVVLALFKNLGAPKRLAILVEGESLFNDATAIMAFKIILPAVLLGQFAGGKLLAGGAEFVMVFLGGAAVGSIIGYLFAKMIEMVESDELIEITLTTILAYAAFIAAEKYLHVSGVMATLAAGVTLGSYHRTKISPSVLKFAEHFWSYLAFVANALIFLMMGLAIQVGDFGKYALPLLVTVVAVHLGRAAGIYSLVPLLTRFTRIERIDRRYQAVMFWGGLRGAISVALALSLPADHPHRPLILTLTMGMVLFTILVNGSTIEGLIKHLGLDRLSLGERFEREQGLLWLKQSGQGALSRLKEQGVIPPAVVLEMSADHQRQTSEIENRIAGLRKERGGISPREEAAILTRRGLNMEKEKYLELFAQGDLSEEAFKELQHEIDFLLDATKEAGPLARGKVDHPLFRGKEERIMRVAYGLLPFRPLVERYKIGRLSRLYEEERARFMVTGQVLEELEELCLSEKAPESVHRLVKRRYTLWMKQAENRLGMLAELYPEYVEKAQRVLASAACLTAERQALERLTSLKTLPEATVQELDTQMRHRLQLLRKRPVEELRFTPVQLLGQIPFFASLSPAELERIGRLLKPCSFLEGEVIIEEGEEGKSMYFISRGLVRVVSRQATLGTLKAGNFFGEMALLTSQPRVATVTAETPCHLLELKREELEGLTKAMPTLKEALERAYRERVAANLLARIPFFQRTLPEERDRLGSLLVAKEFGPGLTLQTPGTVADGLFIIRGGEAESNGIRLKEGDYFGEESLYGQPAERQVTSITPLEALLLSRSALEK